MITIVFNVNLLDGFCHHEYYLMAAKLEAVNSPSHPMCAAAAHCRQTDTDASSAHAIGLLR